MPAPSVLFLGGTGIISSACTARALEQGWEVFVLGRGLSKTRPAPEGCRLLTGDLDDPASFAAAVGDREFDVVADFRAFGPGDVQGRLDLLRGRMGQYVFISSASAYQTPPARQPVLESTPLRNPFWAYSRGKIAAEGLLMGLYRDEGLPVTIVRPSHTYDHTSPPFDGGWTVVDRMRRGAEVVVHGDGTSLWTLTHHTDFARAFVGLLGHPAAIGEAFHITSDEWLSWNQVYEAVAQAAGVEPRLVHVTSDAIAEADPDWGAGLLGDKSHSMVFDNGKVKALVPGWTASVPFHRGASEIVDWFDADPARRQVDATIDATMSRLVEQCRRG
ncbi:NAD-dependent dehydratase [Humibacillus sp. DSM 29435]|uniref:NAD-dependent epimerase/dehydratase family protein n=1 Tax=Humibacillus sp. DSM 29435 TaxID=1869167 RepID=UPI000871EEED|nr:NAD-dependent epimerase/dehydratase family protein [Humibacillus sp. DSM 29435]OFE16797.1 NAD-dependent dehydratase [Humibacillus sp. DSM 29435]